MGYRLRTRRAAAILAASVALGICALTFSEGARLESGDVNAQRRDFRASAGSASGASMGADSAKLDAVLDVELLDPAQDVILVGLDAPEFSSHAQVRFAQPSFAPPSAYGLPWLDGAAPVSVKLDASQRALMLGGYGPQQGSGGSGYTY